VALFSLKADAEKAMRTWLARAQASSTFYIFCSIMDGIYADPTFTTGASHNEPLGYRLALYLLGIHPTHWSVWANRQGACETGESGWRRDFEGYVATTVIRQAPGITEQAAAMQAVGYATSTVPPGKPFPLFDTCRTNVVEGEANTSSIFNI
jgi:hypothetical protein